MAGQLIRRGPRTWLVRVFMGRDPGTGKRRYHNKTIHGTKKMAQEYLNGALRDKDLGRFAGSQRVTLNEYLDRWLESAAKPRVAAKTFEDYESLLRVHIRPALGPARLDKLTPLSVQEVYNQMTTAGLSARTVRYVHAVLKNALGQACKWQLLSVNPADHVELPKQVRSEMRCLSPAEAARFLKAADQDKWGIVFRFALATGMRPGEYLGLQWHDVDWANQAVMVRRSLHRQKGGGWSLKEPKTNRSRRKINLPPSMVKRLCRHRERQPGRAPADFVFATEEGQPLSLRNLRVRHFKPILRRAKLPENLRVYDLRHSFATILLSEGEHPKVVSEALGHVSVTLTLDVYSHVLPTMFENAAAKMEALLFGEDGADPPEQ